MACKRSGVQFPSAPPSGLNQETAPSSHGSSMQLIPRHTGICVSDLSRALRFWCDGLGYHTTFVPPSGPEWAPVLEVEGNLEFTSHFIAKGDSTFELLCFKEPRSFGTPSTTRLQHGLTHLCVEVGADENFDSVINHLVAHGGVLVESTRKVINDKYMKAEVAFVADPDGTRVELLRVTMNSGKSAPMF